MKKLVILMAVFAMLTTMMAVPLRAQEAASPDPSQAGEFKSKYMGEYILVDALILRPLGIAAGLIGLGGSIVAYPFACVTCSGDRVDRELIQKPWDHTFKRPIGDIDF
jgi:hypothetical protein